MLRLLNFLLNHFLFAGTMFFAAGAASLGGGDMGGCGQQVQGRGVDRQS